MKSRTHRPLGFITAALVLLADQVSKWIVMNPLDLRAKGMIELLPIFNLTWVENYGVSMAS